MAGVNLFYDALDAYVVVTQNSYSGWSDIVSQPDLTTIPNNVPHMEAGSLLVRVSTVPIPTAAWLFGTGLISLIGLARRKVRE